MSLARVLGHTLARPGRVGPHEDGSVPPAYDPVRTSTRLFELQVAAVIAIALLMRAGVVSAVHVSGSDGASQQALALLTVASQPLSLVLYLVGLFLVGGVGHLWALAAAPGSAGSRWLSGRLILQYNAIIFLLVLGKLVLLAVLALVGGAGGHGVADLAGATALGLLAAVAIHVTLFLRRVSLLRHGLFLLRWLATPVAAALLTAFFAAFAVADAALTVLRL